MLVFLAFKLDLDGRLHDLLLLELELLYLNLQRLMAGKLLALLVVLLELGDVLQVVLGAAEVLEIIELAGGDVLSQLGELL